MAGTERGPGSIFNELTASSVALAEPAGYSPLMHGGVGAPIGGDWNAITYDIGDLSGARSNADRPAIAPIPPVDRGSAYEDPDAITPMGLGFWWEKMHIVPIDPIEFGIIITQEEALFEIYNAHRSEAQTLTTIVNSVAPGISFPDISVSDTLQPQASALRDTTTGNTGGTGLGTLVQMRVLALNDGLAIFSGPATFAYGIGSVALILSGTRVILIPFRYEWDPAVIDAMEFRTFINQATKGQQQRIATRGEFPRQLLDVRYLLSDVQRQYFQTILFDVQDKVIAVPIYHEEIATTAAVSIGATQYPVEGADDVDFRVGGLAVAITNDYTFDIINITALTDTLITAADPSVNAYPEGTAIVPVRLAVMPNGVPTQREIVNLEGFRVRYAVTDNQTGAMTGDDTPGFWSTYKGLVLFDNCNTMLGSTINTKIDRQVLVIDSAAGSIEISSTLDSSLETVPRNFTLKSRAQIKMMKRLLIALRGPQKNFYVVSNFDDMTVVDDLLSGSATMDIGNIGYTRFLQSREGKTEIRITLVDGTTLEREISSSALVPGSPGVERLTLSSTWGSTIPVESVARVEFITLHHFAQDIFSFRYTQPGFATMRTETVRDVQ